MKRFLLAAAFVTLSSSAFAQQVTLVCKGWGPIYKTFDGWPMNEKSEDDSLIIELDMSKRVAKYRTQLGQMSTKFEEKDNFYWGSTNVNAEVFGKFVSLVNLSINRMTGSTYIAYQFAREGDGKVAFTGTCAPGKPLF